MAKQTQDPFEAMIRAAGEGWMIDGNPSHEEALTLLRGILQKADQSAQKRFGGQAPKFNAADLTVEFKTNPQHVRAFLQALGATQSPDMLVMVWRILQGMEISAVRMEYRQKEKFWLSVHLRSPYGGPDELYQSEQIDDATVLRHFGIMKMDGAPLFDGFYALK